MDKHTIVTLLIHYLVAHGPSFQCTYSNLYGKVTNKRHIFSKSSTSWSFLLVTSKPSCCAMVCCISLLGLLVSLNMACSVLRWMSVNTSLGFFGPCRASSLECDIMSLSIFLFTPPPTPPTPTNIPSTPTISCPNHHIYKSKHHIINTSQEKNFPQNRNKTSFITLVLMVIARP